MQENQSLHLVDASWLGFRTAWLSLCIRLTVRTQLRQALDSVRTNLVYWECALAPRRDCVKRTFCFQCTLEGIPMTSCQSHVKRCQSHWRGAPLRENPGPAQQLEMNSVCSLHHTELLKSLCASCHQNRNFSWGRVYSAGMTFSATSYLSIIYPRPDM